jgi:hypothetical protein
MANEEPDHNLFVEIPGALWRRLLEERDRTGETVREVVIRALVKHLKVPASELPRRRRPGRPPKRPDNG